MGVEHAEKGCFGVEAAKKRTPISAPNSPSIQGISTKYTTIQGLRKTAPVPPRGIEPQGETPCNCSTKRQSVKAAVGKTVGKSEFPADLQKVIAHWSTLPPEVKQPILTLVKQSRQRKREKVV
jgi:hypothetical protein